jgi:hypothetical protein
MRKIVYHTSADGNHDGLVIDQLDNCPHRAPRAMRPKRFGDSSSAASG